MMNNAAKYLCVAFTLSSFIFLLFCCLIQLPNSSRKSPSLSCQLKFTFKQQVVEKLMQYTYIICCILLCIIVSVAIIMIGVCELLYHRLLSDRYCLLLLLQFKCRLIHFKCLLSAQQIMLSAQYSPFNFISITRKHFP